MENDDTKKQTEETEPRDNDLQKLERENRQEYDQIVPDSKKKDSSEPKGRRRIVNIILWLVIICCAIALCIRPFRNWQEQQRMDKLRELATTAVETEAVAETTPALTPETEPEYVSPIDFEELRKVNSDIIGWLTIPGTNIDYPIVQTADNETYLTKTFEGGTSAAGTVFLDCDSDSDLLGYHSILYGHHMKNKTMFTDLVKFKDEDFFREHREVIIYTPEHELHLETVAALYGDDSGEKRRTKFSTPEKFDTYVDAMTKGCSFRQLPQEKVKHLYSFVTCSYEFDNARTILYAVNSN